MFDWVKRLYGEGHIYADFVCVDGSSGCAKAPYIGDPETFDKAEFTEKVKADIWHDHKKRVICVTNIKFL